MSQGRRQHDPCHAGEDGEVEEGVLGLGGLGGGLVAGLVFAIDDVLAVEGDGFDGVCEPFFRGTVVGGFGDGFGGIGGGFEGGEGGVAAGGEFFFSSGGGSGVLGVAGGLVGLGHGLRGDGLKTGGGVTDEIGASDSFIRGSLGEVEEGFGLRVFGGFVEWVGGVESEIGDLGGEAG